MVLPTSVGEEIAREVSKEDLLYPVFEYHLDESDPDILVLRRQDDTFVAAFSGQGFTTEGVIEAAKEDYRELLRVRWARQTHDTEQHKSA